MLLQHRSSQLSFSIKKYMLIAALLILAGLLATFSSPLVTNAAEATPPTEATLRQGMQGMDENGGMISPTMSMAEMGQMMDEMMAQMQTMMATMPMSGTAPTGDMASMMQMGQMMQMMGMMHQQMGQMQMMMGMSMMNCAMMQEGMMGNGMMEGGMMGGNGMDGDKATPEATPAAPPATATPEPEATATPTATVDQSSHDAPPLATAPQQATAGAVTVEAHPLATDDVLDVAFAVTLETHSVELDFDLAERATLTIGDATFPATSWRPNEPSGHHVEGTLHFTIDHPAHASLSDVNDVTLELANIDGATVLLNFAVSHE